MKTYLLNTLPQTTKENRLLFDGPKGGPDTLKGKSAAKPEAADKGKAEKKDDKKEAPTKEKLIERTTALKAKVENVLKDENKDKYTEDLEKGAKEIKGKLEEIEKQVSKLDDKKDIKKDLAKFDEKLKAYEEKGDKDLDKKYSKETLALDESIKKAQVALEAKKKEITAEKVIDILGKKTPPITLDDKQKKALTDKIAEAFKEIEVSLKDDPKATATAITNRVNKAENELKEITVDFFVNAIEKEKKQNELATKAYGIMTKAAGEGKKLDFSVEDLQNVIGLYKLGKHEKPQEKGKTVAIMKALKDNQDALHKAGIDIGFLGGTDGNKYMDKLVKNKAFNKGKKEAFEGLLKFSDADKVTLTQISLIKAYIKAVEDDKVEEFFRTESNKDAFFKGGGFFDLALSYQRAQDRKRSFTDKKDAVLNVKEDNISIELGSDTTKGNEERKSGIVLIDAKEEEAKNSKPKYKVIEGKLKVTPPRDPNNPKEDPKLVTYELKTTALVTGKIEDGNPPSITIEGRTATLEFIGGKLVTKDKDPNDPKKKFTSSYKIEVTEPAGTSVGTITVTQLEAKEHPNSPTEKKPEEPKEKHTLVQNAAKTYIVTVGEKKYNVNIPEATITLEKGPKNNYLKIVLDGKEGHLDFDKDGKNVTARELFDTYDLKVDGTKVTLVKKEAPTGKPPDAVRPPADPTPPAPADTPAAPTLTGGGETAPAKTDAKPAPASKSGDIDDHNDGAEAEASPSPVDQGATPEKPKKDNPAISAILTSKDYVVYKANDDMEKFQKENGGFGFINLKEKTIIRPLYAAAHDFSEGLAAVKSGGKWGYIDKNGKPVIDFQYDNEVKDFHEGLAAVKDGDSWQYIDKNGKETITTGFGRYDWVKAEDFKGGFAKVQKKNGLYGFIDKSGKYITAIMYKEVKDFHEGLAAVQVGDKWGYVNKKGNQIIKPQYDEAEDFQKGLAKVKKGDKEIYISDRGDEYTAEQIMVATKIKGIAKKNGFVDMKMNGDRSDYHWDKIFKKFDAIRIALEALDGEQKKFLTEHKVNLYLQASILDLYYDPATTIAIYPDIDNSRIIDDKIKQGIEDIKKKK